MKIVSFHKPWLSPINFREGLAPLIFLTYHLMTLTTFLDLSILDFSYNLFYPIAWWNGTFFSGMYRAWESYAALCIIIMAWILLYSILYSVIYLLFSKRLASIGNNWCFGYPRWINIIIQLIPFGYVITSIHTIISGKSFWKWLLQEAYYTVCMAIIYIVGVYVLLLYIPID